MIEIFDNIRKIYNFSETGPELADHIEFFSESSFEATKKYITGDTFSVKMFASWTPTFYINLGASYSISVGNKHHFIGTDQDILILRDSIVERHNTLADNIFTVKFNPGGLEAVLGISQLICARQAIDLNTVLPPSLLQKIKQPITFEERCSIMHSFLLQSYDGRSADDYYLRFVRDCIAEYRGAEMLINTSQVAERMFVTSKTINRYFNRVVGIPPKSYFSILRARNALTIYTNQDGAFNPYDWGYYDMSHFYKEVMNFTGNRLSAHSAA